MKIRTWLQGLKLNTKFTGLTLVAVAVPIAILAGVLFSIMEQNVIKESRNNLEYKMLIEKRQVTNCVDAINMSTQFILSDDYMKKMLNLYYRDLKPSSRELIDFQQSDITNIERLVNNNPLLYAVRVYDVSDNVQEMMPIFYRKSRMESLGWAQASSIEGWHFNYTDNLFSSTYTNNRQELLCLVTPIEDYKNGVVGYIEAAMPLETMFPDMYAEAENEWSYFINSDLEMINNGEIPDRIGVSFTDTVGAGVSDSVEYIKKGGRKYVISSLLCPEINGKYICVKDITDEVNRVYNMRNIFVFVMILLLLGMVFLINAIVKSILKQFYSILKGISQVQKGKLDTRIESVSRDEMGELGNQLNTMLDRVQKLMKENIDREVLVKNSEIRSLQNQINAHFIYNVLESIKMMAEIDEEYEISDAITSLGKLLRYSMRWVSGNVKLFEELEYVTNYMILINLRYDFEVHLSINIPEDMMDQEVPKMSFQPVVENAILHGIEPLGEESTIYIKGWYENDDCVFEITDAGKGMTDEERKRLEKKLEGQIETTGGKGNGIGLKNVQDRIRMCFGAEYGLEISSKKDCYTKVALRMPKSKGL